MLVINGIDDSKRNMDYNLNTWYITLWGLMCLPNKGKWNLPVKYSVLIQLPDFVQLHGLILWIIIAIIVFISVVYLLEDPVIDYDSFLAAFASIMVNIKMIGLYYKGGIYCIMNYILKS